MVPTYNYKREMSYIRGRACPSGSVQFRKQTVNFSQTPCEFHCNSFVRLPAPVDIFTFTCALISYIKDIAVCSLDLLQLTEISSKVSWNSLLSEHAKSTNAKIVPSFGREENRSTEIRRLYLQTITSYYRYLSMSIEVDLLSTPVTSDTV